MAHQVVERSSSGAIRSTDSRNRRSEATGACQALVLTSSAEHRTVPGTGWVSGEAREAGGSPEHRTGWLVNRGLGY